MSFTPINPKPIQLANDNASFSSPRKTAFMPLPPLTPFDKYTTPVRSYLCIHSAISIKETILRSIHAQNRLIYALLEPQLNRFEHPWGEWSKYDVIYIYQDIYGPGTGFILFFSQDPAVTSSVGAFLPRKDVMMRFVDELLDGKMVRAGRILRKNDGVSEGMDWFRVAWKEVQRQDGLLREKLDGLDEKAECEIEEQDEESDSEARKIAEIIRREGKPRKDGGFADRSLEWE
ncbi:hypothetical protein EG328_002367 [Venturia inaequalis]|uniref:Uncharacterized protein n=1 Tax=Venturia inaequalis TaxID=5025 RepID=A0A8H3YWZ6_VENIN|nr:hypothetical protein EG328_002367 [Venturia inaequalis]